MHELRDELSNQKSLNEPILFKGEIDLYGDLLKPLCLLKILKRLKKV